MSGFRPFGEAMRRAAIREAAATAEARWFAHERRHHLIFAAAHLAAIACALAVLTTSPLAFGWHLGRAAADA